jgi:hypothetical protein
VRGAYFCPSALDCLSRHLGISKNAMIMGVPDMKFQFPFAKLNGVRLGVSSPDPVLTEQASMHMYDVLRKQFSNQTARDSAREAAHEHEHGLGRSQDRDVDTVVGTAVGAEVGAEASVRGVKVGDGRGAAQARPQKAEDESVDDCKRSEPSVSGDGHY